MIAFKLLAGLPDHNPAEVVAMMRTIIPNVADLDDEAFWREARIAAAAVDYCRDHAPGLPQRLIQAQRMKDEAALFGLSVIGPRWGEDWPFRGVALASD
jgi:uncharacterized short protein YbdD (DUF466 family)